MIGNGKWGNDMEEQTGKLLKECSSGCKMAINSLNQVRDFVKDEKLHQLLDEYDKKHKALEEDISRLLEKHGEQEKDPHPAAAAFSRLTTDVKLMIHDDSSQIAKLLMDGCNMGIQSIGKFLNEYEEASSESRSLAKKLLHMDEQLMKEFSYYAGKEKEHEPYENLRLMSMLYELMYLLCRDDLVVRETVFPINNQKNLERLRGIMQYVEVHYTEEITQYEVAERFYFTKEYFSRFFKKNTGMTFKEYVMHYRLKQAYDPIVYTERSILDIALDCGFADARGLINAFKRVYGDTPYQYRKMHMQKKEHETR
mgnify:FL=1